MNEGVIAEIKELIDLKRYSQSINYNPLAKASRGGMHQSQLRGRGMDFAEVRNYQAGDDIRHMEWRMTARTGRPHVKIYQEEKERPVVLLVDFNPSMFFGTKKAFKSVIAARLAALIAWSVSQHGDRIGGLFYSAEIHNEFTPRGRDRGVLPLLAALSQYTSQSKEQRQVEPRPMSDALLRLKRVVRPGSIIILISDFYTLDQECGKYLKHLKSHNEIIALQIADIIELTSPEANLYPVSDGKNYLHIDTRSNSVFKAYERYCHDKILHVKNSFKSLGITLNLVTPETDLVQLVRKIFSGGKRGS